jgi:fructose-1,6-bisphosphatase
MVPERLRWLYQLNPMAYLVEAYRGACSSTGLRMRAVRDLLRVLGRRVHRRIWIFHRLKYEFADVL